MKAPPSFKNTKGEPWCQEMQSKKLNVRNAGHSNILQAQRTMLAALAFHHSFCDTKSEYFHRHVYDEFRAAALTMDGESTF